MGLAPIKYGGAERPETNKYAGAKADNTTGTHSFGKWNAPRHRPIKQAGPTMIIYAGVKIRQEPIKYPAKKKQDYCMLFFATAFGHRF